MTPHFSLIAGEGVGPAPVEEVGRGIATGKGWDVDAGRVDRLLAVLAATLDALDAEAEAGPERRGDPLWLPGVEHLLVTAVQACVDIARLVAEHSGWAPADDQALMRLLAERGVVPAAHGELLARAVRFRDVLLQDYDAVDPRIVAGRVHNLGDLREFWFSVSRYAYGLT
jgi:uncharacterized protein YutE (UPF0331/DUF86 family)